MRRGGTETEERRITEEEKTKVWGGKKRERWREMGLEKIQG